MIYIGIDNGLSGGIAAIGGDMQVLDNPDYNPANWIFDNVQGVYIWKMPIIKGKGGNIYDIDKITKLLRFLKDEANLNDGKISAVIEKAHTMPINGAKANFTTGECYGMMKGVLTTLRIPYEIVAAKKWQKDIFQGQTVTDTKQASILYCKNKFPDVDWRGTERSKNDHDGKTDAMCMAVYCYRRHRG